MVKRMLASLVSIVVLSTLLSACTDLPEVTCAYEEAGVTFFEPQGYRMFNAGLGYSTEYDGVTYKLAGSLDKTERDRVVSEISANMGRIADTLGDADGEYTVYVCDEAYAPRAEEGALYLGYESLKTVECTAAIGAMLYGNEVNYGVLYGLGASLAKARGYDVSFTDLAEALTLCEEAPEYLDLTYACFLDSYADEQTLEKVRTIAAAFYSYLEENDKTDLVTQYSDGKRSVYFNAFLAEYGKSAYDSTDMDGIVMYGGGQAVRLVWQDAYADFYLMDEYVWNDEDPFFGVDVFNDSYANLRKTIADYRAQAAWATEYLSEYADCERVDVIIGDDEYNWSEYYDGLTFYRPLEVHLFNAGIYQHELIHVITKDYPAISSQEGWLAECIAYYVDSMPLEGNNGYTLGQLAYHWTTVVPDNPESLAFRFLQVLESYLGHAVDFYDLDDLSKFYDAALAYDIKFYSAHETVKTKSSFGKVSFMHYLVKGYGEHAAFNAVLNGTPELLSGQTWDELIDDWEAYVCSEYAWVEELA